MTFSTSAVLAAAFWWVRPSTASVYSRQEWDRLLPGCGQAANFWDAAQCVMQNSPTQCFKMSTPQDLYQCFTAEWEWNTNRKEEYNHTGIVRDIYEKVLAKGIAMSCKGFGIITIHDTAMEKA